MKHNVSIYGLYRIDIRKIIKKNSRRKYIYLKVSPLSRAGRQPPDQPSSSSSPICASRFGPFDSLSLKVFLFLLIFCHRLSLIEILSMFLDPYFTGIAKYIWNGQRNSFYQLKYSLRLKIIHWVNILWQKISVGQIAKASWSIILACRLVGQYFIPANFS